MKTNDDKTVLDTAPWLCDDKLDPDCAYIGVPYKYSNSPITHFWFGPFDPYVAEWLMGAIKDRQKNILKQSRNLKKLETFYLHALEKIVGNKQHDQSIGKAEKVTR